MVEQQPSKLNTRVRFPSPAFAAVAQLVERILGKDEVTSSNLVSSFVVGRGDGVKKNRSLAIVLITPIDDN
jgi:hypothetical protein